MKKSVWLFTGLMAVMQVVVGGELAYENFDHFLLGAISNQSGWGKVDYIPEVGRAPALVSDTQAYSPHNALELSWGNPLLGLTNSIAIYTNFTALYTGVENPVLRCACKMYIESPYKRISVAAISADDDFVGFSVDTNGHIHINEVDIGVPVITNRFVDTVFWYNMANHHHAMEYDYRTIVPWNGPDAGSITQFESFAVARTFDNDTTKGGVFFDDLHIETFPPDTWAWWRFGEENAQQRVREYLGRFDATNGWGLAEALTETATDPVYAGSDYRNTHSCEYPRFYAQQLTIDAPHVTNWTVEAIFRFLPGAHNVTFLHWGTGNGFSTTSSMITVFWMASSTNLACTLRDAEEVTSGTHYLGNLGQVEADNRWRHAAWVKQGSYLLTYVDYIQTSSNYLNAAASGSYLFTTNSHASVGSSLNDGNTASSFHIFDEIRYSTRALEPGDFLQYGEPILDAVTIDGPDLALEMHTISGELYHVETTMNLLDGASWSEITQATATGPVWRSILPFTNTPFFRGKRN